MTRPTHFPSREVATYDYLDAYGELKYQVVRYEPKSFRQRRPDPADSRKWIWNLEGVTPLLYRLPDLLARPEEPVVIVEGEKDADTLFRLGILSTTNSGGAGQVQDSIFGYIAGRCLYIFADFDEVGCNHALRVCGLCLHSGAKSIALVSKPSWWCDCCKDVTDWLTKHHERFQAAWVRRLLEESTEYKRV